MIWDYYNSIITEHQKIINFLDNIPNQPTKFRTKNWVKIYDDARGPFTDCIAEINNTQIDNAKDIDVVMSMDSLIEYSDNDSKASGSLWQYYRDLKDIITNSESIKFKIKITGNAPAAGNTKGVKIAVLLK